MPLEDQKQKLAALAGKSMARNALQGVVDDLTLSPEEKQQRDDERAATNKMRLVKVILGVTFAGVALLTLMSLFAKLWAYAVILMVLAGVGGAGYLVVKPKLKAWNDQRLAGARAEQAEREARAAVTAAAEQKALAAKKLEDDLARLKKQV